MQDKYFKTTATKEDIVDFISASIPVTPIGYGLGASEPLITGCDGNYFQTPDFILYWVGKIPITDPETGEVTGYEADGADHFNVRPITGYPDLSSLDVEEITPNTPYAVFQ